MSTQGKRLIQQIDEGFQMAVTDYAVRQILLHAIEIFSRKGYAGAKIKDIAASAGFSQGYIYNYFKSKDDIFVKIVELAADGAANSVASASRLEGTALQKMTWLTEALLSAESLAMQHWRLIQLQSLTTESLPEEAKRIALERKAEPVRLLIPLIEQGQREGEIREDDPLMLAITYFSIVQGLGISRAQASAGLPFPSAEVVLRFMTKQQA
jgi:Transcriptional regulator